MASMAAHVEAMLAFQRAGAVVFDYGNNLRQRAFDYGVKDAFDYPGFVPAYIRPLFCEGSGPFRWVALSGDPEDIYDTDRIILDLFPENEHLRRWITLARGADRLAGSARAHLLAEVRRARPRRPGIQPGRGRRPRQGAHRHRPRPPGLRLASPAPTARPRGCVTAPMRSPTGRS